MRWYLLLLLFTPLACLGQTCSGLEIVGITDTSAVVRFISDAVMDRIEITLSPSVAGVPFGTDDPGGGAPGTVHGGPVTGLTPSTTYTVSARGRNGGGPWCTPATGGFTTSAARDNAARTPVQPTQPGWFADAINGNNFTGSVIDVAEDCSDLQDKITNSSAGDLIRITPSASCRINSILLLPSSDRTANPTGIICNSPGLPPPGSRVQPTDYLCPISWSGTFSLLALNGAKGWRIIGLKPTPDAPSVGVADPVPVDQWIQTDINTTNVILDRWLIQGGYPQRFYRFFQSPRGSFAFVNSYITGFYPWKPSHFNANLTLGTTLSLGSGASYGKGNEVCSLPAFSTGTWTGQTGPWFAYVTSATAGVCNVTVATPSPITCTNCTNVTGVTAWPASGGRLSVFKLAYGNVNSGVISGGLVPGYELATGFTEGGFLFDASGGTVGPVLIQNNYLGGGGIHIFGGNDSSSGYATDWTIKRNTIRYEPACDTTPQPFVVTMRHLIECKLCERWKIDGNKLENTCSSLNYAEAILINTNAPAANINLVADDFDVTNNIVSGAVNAFTVGTYPNANYPPIPPRRVRFSGNLIVGTDGGKVSLNGAPNRYGSALRMNKGGEVLFTNNTFLPASGTSNSDTSVIRGGGGYCSGGAMRINNNIIGMSTIGGAAGVRGLWSYSVIGPCGDNGVLVGAASLSNILGTSQWLDNVGIGGYSSAGVDLTQSQTTALATIAPTMTAWPSGESLSARLNTAGLRSDGRAKYGSPYFNKGANFITLDSAIGNMPGAWIASTDSSSITAAWTAPDTYQCWARSSSSSPWVKSTGYTTRQSVILTGLTTKTVYDVEIACAVERKILRARTQ